LGISIIVFLDPTFIHFIRLPVLNGFFLLNHDAEMRGSGFSQIDDGSIPKIKQMRNNFLKVNRRSINFQTLSTGYLHTVQFTQTPDDFIMTLLRRQALMRFRLYLASSGPSEGGIPPNAQQ
jgi:hypothetical protein